MSRKITSRNWWHIFANAWFYCQALLQPGGPWNVFREPSDWICWDCKEGK